MKSKITALLLSVALCIPGTERGEVCAMGLAADGPHHAGEAYVDLSGQVIQEGGGLSDTDAHDLKSTTQNGDEKKQQVQKALMAAWDSAAKSCDLSGLGITPEFLRSVYFETLNEYPVYFYVKSGYGVSFSGNTVLRVEIQYNIEDTAVLPQMLKDYSQTVTAFRNKADSSFSDMEKALYIHDYLARNCAYDTSYSRHSAYDALVGRSAVCQGYTLAFKELAQQLGLSCEIVTSDTLNHAWNLVRINGSYYHVDVTFDDPVADSLGRARHQFFMKSSDYFMSAKGLHAADDWEITGGVSAMAAADKRYDNYFWNQADAGFDYAAGRWYGFDGVDSIDRYTCSGTEFVSTGEVAVVKDKWPVIGGEGRFWTDKFVGTGMLDEMLYYSGADTIYQLNINTGMSLPAFSLTDSQKQKVRLYGMHVLPSGEIRYRLSENPNQEGQIRALGSYWVVFDGNGADSGRMNQMEALKAGQEYRLPQNQFRKKGYILDSWNTRADGSGTSYAPDGGISRQAGEDGTGVTLYARWKVETAHNHIGIRGRIEASCFKKGYTGDHYCLDCGELVEKGRQLDTLPHTKVTDRGTAATCVSSGKSQGSHCGVCGMVIVAQRILPATGHSWNDFYTVDKTATFLEEGSESVHCSKCDATKDSRNIPKMPAQVPGGQTGGGSSGGSGSQSDNSTGNGSQGGSGGASGDGTAADDESEGDGAAGLPGGNDSGGSSGGSGGSSDDSAEGTDPGGADYVTRTSTVVNEDGSICTTVTVTDKTGKIVRLVTTVKHTDGTAEKTVKKTIAGDNGIDRTVTITTATDHDGNVTGKTQETVISKYREAAVTVTVTTDGQGMVRSAEAAVSKALENENQAALDGDTISLIRETAGQDVPVTIFLQDAYGVRTGSLRVHTADLKPFSLLYLYRYLAASGEYLMVSVGEYPAGSDGSIVLTMPDTGACRLVNSAASDKIVSRILKTVVVKKPRITVKRTGSKKFKFSSVLNMRNVKTIRYKTSAKQVAAVTKSGRITGRSAGTAVIKAVVTLKNGAVKTVRCKVLVR